ncbi:DUF2249 domain-containing protein [Paenibacillus sanguinis]|uniref:DUF2249 domain-containing protein n=1 Tax=Paenibacillus sanguinis TaxID=225906 RepID=UPI00036613E3|nr:DUF2249 domain-containing protein [Paenibacillus sanguinis]
MNQADAKVIELDVREQLRNKLEPFQLIMDTLKTVEQDDIFVLHATFKPTPLIGLLKMKGFAGKAEMQEKEHWVTTFVHKKHKDWLAQQPEGSVEAIIQENRPNASSDAQDCSGEPKQVIIELDNRGLEPPQPMVRTLAAIGRSKPGGEVHIHNDRIPVFLIEELNNLGCTYTVDEQPDGSAKVKIRKP